MNIYEVKYKDEDGCHHDVEITAYDIPKAINVAFAAHKDCRQVIRVFLKSND